MVAAVRTTSRYAEAPLSRMSFDRLDIARVRAGRWSIASPSTGDSTAWPYLALYSLSGDLAIGHASRAIPMGKGDVVVVRNSAVLDIHSGLDSELLVIRIPEGTVGPYAHSLDAADGKTISTMRGTASLVAHLLEGLAAQPDDFAPDNPGRLAQHIVGLVALMCADGRVTAGGSVKVTMLQKAKDYIEVHLGDLDLTPDRLASALNISTRTLHRLFESEGLTISGWIRVRRLEQCRVELGDATSEALSVSAIGAKWGLWDAAHFSRLFKAAYGLSPRAYRTATTRPQGADRYLA